MTGWIILAGYLMLLGYLWRRCTRNSWLASRKEYPGRYDDSSYEKRDSPHGRDVGAGLLLGVFGPVVVWVLLWEVTRGGRSRRWERARDRRLSLREENLRLKEIIKELEETS